MGTKKIPDTDVEIFGRRHHYLQVDKLSAWKKCGAGIPDNMKADSFKSCKNASFTEDDNLDLVCQLSKRGILDAAGEVDQVNLAEKFASLANTVSLIQGCVDWEIQDKYSRILGMVDNWDDYHINSYDDIDDYLSYQDNYGDYYGDHNSYSYGTAEWSYGTTHDGRTW